MIKNLFLQWISSSGTGPECSNCSLDSVDIDEESSFVVVLMDRLRRDLCLLWSESSVYIHK